MGLKPQVCYFPSLQARSGSSNFGSYHVKGTKRASRTRVDQNQAHCLNPEAGMGPPFSTERTLLRKSLLISTLPETTQGILGLGKQAVDITS